MNNIKITNKNFQLTVGELKKIYNQMKIAIDKNKHHLDCVYFNRVDGELVTTDGMQLLVHKYQSIKLENATEDDNFILFSNVIKDILKNKESNEDNIIDFIKNEEGGDYTMKINNRCFKNNEEGYCFPQYKNLIEGGEEQDENVEKKKTQGLLSACVNVFDFSQYKDRIINFCKKAISLKANSYKLNLYCEDSTKLYLAYNADEFIVYDTIILQEKQNINLSFNIQMFLNSIQNNKNSLCCFDKMYYSDNKSPFLAKKDDVLYGLMPFADGVDENSKNFVKDKTDNNIDEVVFKIQKQENKIILQKDFDLEAFGRLAPSKKFITNYKKAMNFFKVKDTMEEICNKRKRRKKLKFDRDIYSKSNLYFTQHKRIYKLNKIKEERIISGDDIKQYDYVWFENEQAWRQFDILGQIFEKKIKNITEISKENLQHYTQILSICKQRKYLSSYQKKILADVENKLLSIQTRESGEKQEIEHKQEEEQQTQQHEHEQTQEQSIKIENEKIDCKEQQQEQRVEEHTQEEQQTDIDKKVIICNCYFTRAKWSEKNKRFQNETGRFDKIQYTIKNGVLNIYRTRTGELLERSIKADDLSYDNEKKKWIYTRKREGEQRLRIDFDENIFELIKTGQSTQIKQETTKKRTTKRTTKKNTKGVLIKFATQAIKKIRRVAMFNF